MTTMLAGSLAEEAPLQPPPPVIGFDGFDVSRDFSPVTNPSGVWSYGWLERLDGEFTLLRYPKSFSAENLVPISGWQVSNSEGPGIYRNMGETNAISVGGAFSSPPGGMWVFPGNEGTRRNFGTIRFRMPEGSGGYYRIETRVESVYSAVNLSDSEIRVSKNGVEIFGQVVPPASGTGFTNVIGLAAGETVDFSVGAGPDGAVASSGLKIEARLVLVNIVPPVLVRRSFDLSAGYSTATNPAGPWSFGWKATPTARELSLLPYGKSLTAENGVPIFAWQEAPNQLPSVAKVIGPGTAVSAGGQFTAVPGTVYFTAGEDGSPRNFGVIRFTMPANRAGDYVISTSVRDVFDGAAQGDTDFYVVHNGEVIFEREVPAHSSAEFMATRSIQAGDRIEFVVGRGLDGHQSGSGLKITATLTAPYDPPGQTNCVPAPEGLAAWWPFNGDARDALGLSPLELSGHPEFKEGRVEHALQFDGLNDFASAPASPALNIGTGDGFTIETWVNPTHVTLQPMVEWSAGPAVTGVHFWLGVYGSGSLFANLIDTGGNSHSWRSETDIVLPNQWQHVAMSYQKSAGLLRFYLNGVKVTEHLLGTFEPQTGYPVLIGRRPEQEHFSGSLDELSLYRRVLADHEIAAIHSAGGSGKCGVSQPPPPPGDCKPAAHGVVAWWGAERNPNDLAGTNRGTLFGGAGYGAGKVGEAFLFPGGESGVKIPASPSLNVGAGPGLTIEGWINPGHLSVRSPLVEWNRGGPGIVTWGVHLYILRPDEFGLGAGNLVANLADAAGSPHFIMAPGGTLTAGIWQHIALTYDRETGVGRLYRNGVVVAEANLGNFTPETRYDLFLGRRPAGDAPLSFRGLLDEITIYSRALSAAEIDAVAGAGAAGKCRIPSSLSELVDLVEGIPSPGNPQPLLATLKAVRASLQRGNLLSALHQLGAFQNQVRAQLGGVNPGLSAQIIALAQFLIETVDPTGARRAELLRVVDTPMRVIRAGRIPDRLVNAWRIEGAGRPGIVCCVQRSVNLDEWEHAGFATEIDNGVFELVDEAIDAGPMRFYRLQEP